MKTDEEFRNRVTKAESAETRTAIVEAEGLNFTNSEIEKVMMELSDEELSSITGGSGGPNVYPGVPHDYTKPDVIPENF